LTDDEKKTRKVVPVDERGDKGKSMKSEDEWKCSACGKIAKSIPMIGCDSCDSWFHWSCVGIVSAPKEEEIWICADCRRVKPLKKKSKEKSLTPFPSPKGTTCTPARTGPRIKTGSGHPSKKGGKATTVAATSSAQPSTSTLPSSSLVTSASTSSQSSSLCASCGTCKSSSGWIACDSCDLWFHWECVGIIEEPAVETWFCYKCISRFQVSMTSSAKSSLARK